MLDMPYFMENDDWFYFDIGEKKFMLTEEANQKAKRSYAEFYKELNFEH